MNVLEIVTGKGIDLRKVSGHKGGEYHGPCPICRTGTDRFHVWPEQNGGAGSWWCRQCGKGGDGIALVMATEGMGYKEACAALGMDAKELPPMPYRPRRSRPANDDKRFKPGAYQSPKDQWRRHAQKFAAWAHEQLLNADAGIMQKLKARGLGLDTVKKWGLGWNPGKEGKDLFRAREAWGLPSIPKKDGRDKKLWLPRGLVIPYRRDGVLQRIRIRRPATHLRSDRDPRYYVVPGSGGMPMLIGKNRRAYIVVETELDGYLIDRAAGGLCGVVALGAAANMPDPYCQSHLDQAMVILLAHDYDQAGGRAAIKWRGIYPQARRWGVPEGKDPGEAYQLGVNIKKWVFDGLPPAWHVGPSPFIARGLKGGGGATPEAEKKSAPEPVALPASVRTLAAMLDQYPVYIINTPQHMALKFPATWANDKVKDKLSKLVFTDPDCIDFLDAHPEEKITAGNFFLPLYERD